jgi:hypothetical protein
MPELFCIEPDDERWSRIDGLPEDSAIYTKWFAGDCWYEAYREIFALISVIGETRQLKILVDESHCVFMSLDSLQSPPFDENNALVDERADLLVDRLLYERIRPGVLEEASETAKC